MTMHPSQHNINPTNPSVSDIPADLFDEFDQGLYIGIMSGTSLDGIDAVLVKFLKPTDPTPNSPATPAVKLIASHSIDFAYPLRQVLLALCQPNGHAKLVNQLAHTQSLKPSQPSRPPQTDNAALLSNSTLSTSTLPAEPLENIDTLSELDWAGWASREYAEQTSTLVHALLDKAQRQSQPPQSPQSYDCDAVMAIGCHGQTVRHRPQFGFSTQLMDANVLAERTGISVVSDFRRRDMAVGGQGAPLVPAFHHAMFADKEQWRVIVNLGGIANITILPPLSLGQTAYGYDTGPANLLLDAWITRHSESDDVDNVGYDAGGQFAQSGRLIEPLLHQLLAHDYFAKPAPKSTGREDFHLSWLDEQLQIFAQHHPDVRYSPADVQNTLTELTAISVANEINRIHRSDAKPQPQSDAQSDVKPIAVFACGGGAYNDYLLLRMASHISQLFGGKIASTDQLGLPPTWVEATAFAWLAKQTLMGQTGNLPSVTGADKAVVLGQVCFA